FRMKNKIKVSLCSLPLTPTLTPPGQSVRAFRGSLPYEVLLTKEGKPAPPLQKGPTVVSLTPCFSKVDQPLTGSPTVSTVSFPSRTSALKSQISQISNLQFPMILPLNDFASPRFSAFLRVSAVRVFPLTACSRFNDSTVQRFNDFSPQI